jgi:hypothetical protein
MDDRKKGYECVLVTCGSSPRDSQPRGSVFVDGRMRWVKAQFSLWMRLQVSEDMERLLKVPGSGHSKVAR